MDEREFELINIIGAELGSNQRDLSRHLDLSLGQTNMLIRRLISKGYIRITQLNKRKVNYLLTPKGMAEKMRKSINYTLKTISSITLIKEKIKEIITDLYNSGDRNFVVLGKSDFALLIEIVLKDIGISDYKITYIEELPEKPMEGTLINCKEDVQELDHKFKKSVDLIYELSKDRLELMERNIIVKAQKERITNV